MSGLLKIFVIFILILALAGFGFIIMDVERKKAQLTGVPEPGVLAEANFIDFTLVNLDGAPINLAATVQKNRVTLVNFWATWCGPCRREIPDLIDLYRDYKSQGVELLAVNIRENTFTVRQFVQSAGMNFPILLDSDAYVASQYQVRGIPTTYIIDGKGRVRDRIVGSTTQDVLEAKINAILREN